MLAISTIKQPRDLGTGPGFSSPKFMGTEDICPSEGFCAWDLGGGPNFLLLYSQSHGVLVRTGQQRYLDGGQVGGACEMDTRVTVGQAGEAGLLSSSSDPTSKKEIFS